MKEEWKAVNEQNKKRVSCSLCLYHSSCVDEGQAKAMTFLVARNPFEDMEVMLLQLLVLALEALQPLLPVGYVQSGCGKLLRL